MPVTGRTAQLTNNKDAELTRETSIGEYIPKRADEAMKKATKAGKELLQSVTEAGLRVWSVITIYTAQYPLFGVFLTLFIALSFLPIVSFLIFVVVSLVIAVSSAVVAVLIIEGILVSIAGTLLLATLFIALTTATFLLGWVAFFIYGFRAVNFALNTLNTWQQQSVSAAAAAAVAASTEVKKE